MIESVFNKRIRYAETDKMGYLYYGNYAQLYEIGRAEMIRDLGLSYREMEDELRIMMPVVSLECRYIKAALYDDMLSIRTSLREMPDKMITFHHEVCNESGDLLNRGVVKLFFIDMKSNRRISCPPYLSQKLIPYF